MERGRCGGGGGHSSAGLPAAAEEAAATTATATAVDDDRLSIAARSGRKSRCIRTPDRYFVASDDRSSRSADGRHPTADTDGMLSLIHISEPTRPY